MVGMVAKQYSYLVNKYKVPADVVGKTMEKIEERDGKVTKESFLEESRPVSSPTHKMFEWTDAIAAEKYRLEQSSEIIRNIQIEIVEVPAKEVQLEIKTVTADELREQEEKKKPIYARAFVNTVKSDPKHAGQYRSIDKALSDKESRRIVLENALYEFKRLATKYSFLKELELVKDAIEEVEQKIESA